jgi:hypothetical protein
VIPWTPTSSGLPGNPADFECLTERVSQEADAGFVGDDAIEDALWEDEFND